MLFTECLLKDISAECSLSFIMYISDIFKMHAALATCRSVNILTLAVHIMSHKHEIKTHFLCMFFLFVVVLI